MIWNISLVNLDQVTQQCPSHLLAHPRTTHCVRKKQLNTVQAFFSSRKHWQDLPVTSKAESAEVCWPGLCPLCTIGDSLACLHNLYSLTTFKTTTTKYSLVFRWNYFFCSLSAVALVVNTTEKSLSPFSFPLIQFFYTPIKSLLSLLFSGAKFSQPLS